MGVSLSPLLSVFASMLLYSLCLKRLAKIFSAVSSPRVSWIADCRRQTGVVLLRAVGLSGHALLWMTVIHGGNFWRRRGTEHHQCVGLCAGNERSQQSFLVRDSVSINADTPIHLLPGRIPIIKIVLSLSLNRVCRPAKLNITNSRWFLPADSLQYITAGDLFCLGANITSKLTWCSCCLGRFRQRHFDRVQLKPNPTTLSMSQVCDLDSVMECGLY